MHDFYIFKTNVFAIAVCTSLQDKEEIERRANAEIPTRIGSDWAISDKPFLCGTPQGNPCGDFPETHKHYMLVC